MKNLNGNAVWTVRQFDADKVNLIKEKLCLSEFIAKILVSKGFDTPEKASTFLDVSHKRLYDPFDLCDMRKAVDRIKKAIEDNEKIMIYGDYDVDGITSVALIFKYLCDKGAQVFTYIPERISEGYGLNESAIDKFSEDGISLIITVDSGITALDEIEYAKNKGIEVVVTDHHECRNQLPKAVAVVNPHRPDNTYPFCELAGVGVVFKLVCALEDNKNISSLCTKYADIVALGTVADVMPIVDENRVIVALGLKQLSNSKTVGLSELISQSFAEKRQSSGKNLTASSIGFTLAPRINAAGRIGDVNKALRLLITNDQFEAQEIAAYLCAVNRERQIIENNIIKEAEELILSQTDLKNDKVIVLSSDKWHIGVIGIVASKITEKYSLPSILISDDGTVGKGSCRSVKGFNINEALCECKDLLVKYGGHELAAGVTVESDKIDLFRKKINEYAKENFDFNSICNFIDADLEIGIKDVSVENAVLLRSLEPFGLMNPNPIVCLRDVKICEVCGIGDGKHTKLVVEKDSKRVTALQFGMPRDKFKFNAGDTADFMCNIDLNEFRGYQNVQLLVKDVRMCSRDFDEMSRQIDAFSNIFEKGCDAEHIPSLKDFKSSFMYLKRVCSYDTFCDLDVLAASKQITKDYQSFTSMLMLNIELVVFEEMGLVVLERIDEIHVRVKLVKTNEKVNLDNSKILCDIKKLTV